MSRERNSPADVDSADTVPPFPAELQSLETALAALVPRRDRLDADRILFRAGQLSVRGQRRWMPTTLAALFGAAATLLVTFLVPSEPRVVERVCVVYVPAVERQEDPAGPSKTNEVAASTDRSSQELQSESFPLPGSRAAELERIDRMLQAGADPWPGTSSVADGDVAEPSRVLPYREYLRVLLESQPDHLQSKPSKRPLETGANS